MKKYSINVVFAILSLVVVGFAADDVDSLIVSFSNPSQPGTIKTDMMFGGIKVRTHSGKEVIILSKESDETQRLIIPEMNFDMDIFVDNEYDKESDPDKAKGLQKIQSSQFGLNVEEQDNIIEINMPAMNIINRSGNEL